MKDDRQNFDDKDHEYWSALLKVEGPIQHAPPYYDLRFYALVR